MNGEWTVSFQVDPTLYVEQFFFSPVNGRHEDVDGLLLKGQYLILIKDKSLSLTWLDMGAQLFQKSGFLAFVCEKGLDEEAVPIGGATQQDLCFILLLLDVQLVAARLLNKQERLVFHYVLLVRGTLWQPFYLMELELRPQETEFFIDKPCNGGPIISREGMDDFGFIQFVTAWGRGVTSKFGDRTIQKSIKSFIKIDQCKHTLLHMLIGKDHTSCIENIGTHFMALGSNRDILIP